MSSSTPSPIPYDRLLADLEPTAGILPSDPLLASLEDAWLAAYCDAASHITQVLSFEDGGFRFLFDHASAAGSDVDDRLVVGYGASQSRSKPRDAARMRGFLAPRLDISGKGVFDKGHVLAHAMGGGLDVNLFPQRPDLNRGRSACGRIYRRMERYVASHPGTFVFSRLWYTDSSWVPASLEYGVLLPAGRFWVEQFLN